MTMRIKLTVFAVFVAVLISVIAFTSSRNLYKNPYQKGTFVFERLENDQWMFI